MKIAIVDDDKALFKSLNTYLKELLGNSADRKNAHRKAARRRVRCAAGYYICRFSGHKVTLHLRHGKELTVRAPFA